MHDIARGRSVGHGPVHTRHGSVLAFDIGVGACDVDLRRDGGGDDPSAPEQTSRGRGRNQENTADPSMATSHGVPWIVVQCVPSAGRYSFPTLRMNLHM